MQSVFMDDIKRELSGAFTPEESGAMQSYKALVSSENLTLSLVGVVLGNLAFTILGYHAQSVARNTPFFLSSSIKLIIVGIIIGVLLWAAKSVGAYASWKFFSDYRRSSDMFSFFAVEGMSDFVYVVFIPIYLLALLFDLGFAAIGMAVFAKMYIMYASYPAVLQKCTSLDRILCVLSSMGVLVLVRGLIYVVAGI